MRPHYHALIESSSLRHLCDAVRPVVRGFECESHSRKVERVFGRESPEVTAAPSREPPDSGGAEDRQGGVLERNFAAATGCACRSHIWGWKISSKRVSRGSQQPRCRCWSPGAMLLVGVERGGGEEEKNARNACSGKASCLRLNPGPSRCASDPSSSSKARIRGLKRAPTRFAAMTMRTFSRVKPAGARPGRGGERD